MKVLKNTWELCFEQYGILCTNLQYIKINHNQKNNVLNTGISANDITSAVMYGLVPNFIETDDFNETIYCIFGACENYANIFPSIVVSRHEHINICFKSKKYFFSPGEFKFYLVFKSFSTQIIYSSFIQQADLSTCEITANVENIDNIYKVNGYMIKNANSSLSISFRCKIESHFIKCNNIILTNNNKTILNKLDYLTNIYNGVLCDARGCKQSLYNGCYWVKAYTEYYPVTGIVKFVFVFNDVPQNITHCNLTFSFIKQPQVNFTEILTPSLSDDDNILIPILCPNTVHIAALTSTEIEITTRFTIQDNRLKNLVGLVFQDSTKNNIITNCQVWHSSSGLILKIYNPTQHTVTVNRYDILAYALLTRIEKHFKDSTAIPTGFINNNTFSSNWSQYNFIFPLISLPVTEFKEWPQLEDQEPMEYLTE